MAIYCENCRCIFKKQYHNCPRCGDRLKIDSITDGVLASKGYIVFGAKVVSVNKPGNSDHGGRDTLNDIRNMFGSSVRPKDKDKDISTGISLLERNETDSNTNDNSFRIDDKNTLNDIRNMFGSDSVHKDKPVNKSDSNTHFATDTSTNTDFFSNSDSEEFRIDSIEIPTGNTPPPRTDNVFDHNPSNRRPIRTHRAIRPARIPWRAVLRIAAIVGVVCLCIALWNGRHMILNGILNLILSLIPLALVVFGIIYLIRILIFPK